MDKTKFRSLLVLCLLVPAPTIGVMASMMWPATRGTGLGQGIYMTCKVWLLVLPLVWYLVIEKGKLGFSPMKQGGMKMGLGSGLVIGAMILGVFALFGDMLVDAEHVRAQAEQNGIAKPLVFLGLAAYLSFINALLEEYVWRWFVFKQWENLVAPKVGVVLAAACFTLHHVFALAAQFDWLVTTLASIGVFTGGLIWSWTYNRYRSIWPGYVSHVLVDIAIMIIGWKLIF